MRRDPGYALPELLVAMAIFSLAMASLGGFEQSMGRFQSLVLTRVALGNNASMLGQTLGRYCASASIILYPGKDDVKAASALLGENIDSADGVSPLDPAAPRVLRLLCAEPAGGLYMYEASPPMPSITCGELPPAGVSRVLVAGQEGGIVVKPQFRRISNNSLWIGYTLKLGQLTLDFSTQLSMRAAVD